MPWCPNCKLEYDEGETLCKGCGLDLSEETSEQVIFETEAFTKEIPAAVSNSTLVEETSEETEEYISLDNNAENTETETEDYLIAEDSEYEVSEPVMHESLLDDISETDETKDYSIETDVREPDSVEINVEETDVEETDVEETNLEETDLEETNLEETNLEETNLEEVNLEKTNSAMEESLTEEEEKELIKNIKHPDKSNTYIKKEEQYKDLISSAYSFGLIAILGIGLLVLNVLGIIQIFNGALSYIVMGALFIAFLYVGITSYTKAIKVKSQISEENQVTDSITKWLSENITAAQLDSYVNPADTDEIQFMQKIDKMKELITATFGELDELYLDRLVEEYYNNTFESDKM
ncbi:MAG: hypothetical protein K0R92_1633 [Lachnospiraceae bacterium]|nr:hypothetical protein [Lachnospiraceae bacterium]